MNNTKHEQQKMK